MKRIFAGVFVAVSLFSMGVMAQPVPNTLGKIKAAKSINVAYSPDALPFSFVAPNGEPAGYSIDLCKRVIDQIGRAVGEPNLKVNWVAGSTPERLQMVASGKADLECANTTQTLGRLANLDFSGLTFIDAGTLIVKADSAFHRMADLGGRKIAVLKGSTTETRLAASLQQRVINATVVPVAGASEAMALLAAGGVDAFAGDKLRLVGLAAQANTPGQFALMAEEFSFEPYAMALPRGDAALRLEVNRALSQVYLSGEIEVIFGQWLGIIGRPTDLLVAMYFLNAIPE